MSTYDVFISYRHADIAAAKALAESLQASGLQVWIDESRIEDFASIQHSVEEGLENSKSLLALYSASYPASPACQWELTRAFLAAQQEGDPRRRVLVLNPEQTNTHIHPIELRDALYRNMPSDPTGMRAHAQAVSRHVRELQGTFGNLGEPKKPEWYGTTSGYGSNRFVGRLTELWAIHSSLWSADVPIIQSGESRPLCCLTGIGGSGKSLAAEEYGNRFATAYPAGIFWLRAFGHDTERPKVPDERRTLLNDQLIHFCQRLGIESTNLRLPELRSALNERLAPKGAYLWVVDDLPSRIHWEEAQEWLAPGVAGRTLVTTRSQTLDWAGHQVLIGELDHAAAESLLTHARKPNDPVEQALVRPLAHALGNHALALELAAVAVKRRGFAEFFASLQNPSRDALDFAAELLLAQGQELPHREPGNLNLSTTLLLSIDEVSDAGRDVLRLGAQLAAAPIERQLVIKTWMAADGLDTQSAEDRTDLAVASVVAQSLAREKPPMAWEIHSLVSRAVRYRETDKTRSQQLRSGAISALNQMLLDDRVFDIRRHSELADAVEHIRVLLADRLIDAGPLVTPEMQLLDSLYIYNAQRGNYYEARRIAERLIAFHKKNDGEEHPLTLTFMGYLGKILRLQGDLVGSRDLHYRVLEIRMRTQGASHPDTHRTVSHAAQAEFALGNYAIAEKSQKAALEYFRRQLGERHSDTIDAMNNLALTLYMRHDLAGARELQERVFALRREQLGNDHPETLAAMGNLAETLRAQGDVESALESWNRLDASSKPVLDETHPDNLTHMHNRAAALFSQGDFAGARELTERVLEHRSRLLGPAHIDTLTTRNNLGAMLLKLDQLRDAREILELGQKLCLDSLGASHPQTLWAVYHLALVLDRLGERERFRNIVEQFFSTLSEPNLDALPGDLRETLRGALPYLLIRAMQPA